MNPPIVQAFTKSLGWPEPEFFQHKLPPDIVQETGEEIVEWAECRLSDGLFLQVNCVRHSDVDFRACVYALRYRICSGWRRVSLAGDAARRTAEIERVRPYFALGHFTDPESRRQYRQQYPLAAGYTWKRIQQEGAPQSS